VVHARSRARAPDHVELDFVEDKRGTVVSVRESGFVDDEEGRAGLSAAASAGGALSLMKFYVEHGVTY
jgi:hypothetical protein